MSDEIPNNVFVLLSLYMLFPFVFFFLFTGNNFERGRA